MKAAKLRAMPNRPGRLILRYLFDPFHPTNRLPDPHIVAAARHRARTAGSGASAAEVQSARVH